MENVTSVAEAPLAADSEGKQAVVQIKRSNEELRMQLETKSAAVAASHAALRELETRLKTEHADVMTLIDEHRKLKDQLESQREKCGVTGAASPAQVATVAQTRAADAAAADAELKAQEAELVRLEALVAASEKEADAAETELDGASAQLAAAHAAQENKGIETREQLDWCV